MCSKERSFLPDPDPKGCCSLLSSFFLKRMPCTYVVYLFIYLFMVNVKLRFGPKLNLHILEKPTGSLGSG